MQILNGIVYIFTENNAFSYSGNLEEISSIFEKSKIICYDAKSIWHTLDKASADLTDTVFYDLGIYSYVINPGSKAASVASLVANFASEAIEVDAVCVHLFPEIEKNMRERIEAEGLSKILFEIEIPLINILASMEKTGFKIEPGKMLEFGEALEQLALDLQSRVYIQAGKEFNINSPKQLGEVLFEDLALPYKKKKTKTGYSTDAETLEELRSVSPIIDDILEYRQVTKLRGTYAIALPEVADENDRIHTDFKQALTATGRLSSADPNLQNIPIRTELGRELRRFFIPSKPGYLLIDADYSQIELRLMAALTEDENMCRAFREGHDIHTSTASKVFGVDPENVTIEMRKRSKAVNFGILYGMGDFSLAEDLHITRKQAKEYIDNYLSSYPKIDAYLTNIKKTAAAQGYVTTMLGRRRYIPELSSPNKMVQHFGERVAMNSPIQGSAADIIKLAMIAVHRRLKESGMDAKLILQVHDELLIEANAACRDEALALLREEMENAVKLCVPLDVSVAVGENWYDAK